MRLSQLSDTHRYYYEGSPGHADGARWRRSKKRFSTLLFFFFFSIFSPFVISDSKEKTSPQLQKRRVQCFERFWDAIGPLNMCSICANNIANSRSGMGKTGELHETRGGSRGENLLGAMESRAESEWHSSNRRMCYTPWSRRASPRPPRHLRTRVARWDTHGQQILFDEFGEIA